MNTPLNDGGPVFPIESGAMSDPGSNGISLRDHFAGLAMLGMLASGDQWGDATHTSTLAFQWADAMITEREKAKP